MLIKQNCLHKEIKYNLINKKYKNILENKKIDNSIKQITNYINGNELKRVFLVQENNEKFIFKHTIEKEVISRVLISVLYGGFYARLFRKLNKRKKQDITANLLSVIEKRLSYNTIETYMLYEYIEGKPISEINKDLINNNDIIDSINNLHKYKLVSGDLNPNNIIYTKKGLKIIDLSSRNSFYFGRIKDIIDLKIIYNIDYPISENILYKFIKWKKTRK